MTNFAMLKPCGAIIKKLNIPELTERFKGFDAEKLASHDENEVGRLGEMIISLFCENLENVADDIVDLCAAYKCVSREEMLKESPIQVLPAIFKEPELADFFGRALKLAGGKK